MYEKEREGAEREKDGEERRTRGREKKRGEESEEERRRRRSTSRRCSRWTRLAMEVKRTDGRTDGRTNPGRARRTHLFFARHVTTATSYDSSHGRSRVATGTTGHLRLSALTPASGTSAHHEFALDCLSLLPSFSPLSLLRLARSLSAADLPCVRPSYLLASLSLLRPFLLPPSRSLLRPSAFSPTLFPPRRPSLSFSHG